MIKGKKVHAVVFCLYEIKEQSKTKNVIAEWQRNWLGNSVSKFYGVREMFYILYGYRGIYSSQSLLTWALICAFHWELIMLKL